MIYLGSNEVGDNVKRYIKANKSGKSLQISLVYMISDYSIAASNRDNQLLFHSSSSLKQALYDDLNEFVGDVLDILEEYGYTDVHQSQSSRGSDSYYIEFFFENDKVDPDLQIYVSLRISDHDLDDPYSNVTDNYYRKEAKRYGDPSKEQRIAKLVCITIDEYNFNSYKGALAFVREYIENLDALSIYNN